MLRARANGETSELATMCRRLPGPLLAASRFVDVPEEEINLMKENGIPRNTKQALKFEMTLFKVNM